MHPLPRSIPRRCALGALWLLSLAALGATALAEPVYVKDRLLVAMREAPAAQAPVVALLVSGTAVEVLERRGDHARVRAPDGKEGWVELAYLTKDLPAALVIERLEREADALRARIARLEAQTPQAASTEADEVARLRQELASERLRNAELQARLTTAERDRQQPAAPGTAELERLQGEVSRLRAALEKAGAGHAPPSAPAALGWRVLAAVAALLVAVAFALGAWFVDWRVRQRHGGFRV